MPIRKTEAIVIKTLDWHETSKIITFYTKKYGKITGVAKGARRSSFKFGSSLEILTYNDVVFYEREGRELHTISQCDLKESFLGLRQDLRRLAYASYVLELIGKARGPSLCSGYLAKVPLWDLADPIGIKRKYPEPMARGVQESQSTFDLLLRTLGLMQDSSDPEAITRVFEVKLLTNLGYQLHLGDCSICRSQISGSPFKFSLSAGGIICPEHQQEGVEISGGTLAFLREAQELDLAQIDQVRISHIDAKHLSSEPPIYIGDKLRERLNLRAELKDLLRNFIAYHIEPTLKSRKFIEALEEKQ